MTWDAVTAGVSLGPDSLTATVAAVPSGTENLLHYGWVRDHSGTEYVRFTLDTAAAVIGFTQQEVLLPAGQSYRDAPGVFFDLAAGLIYHDGVQVGTFSGSFAPGSEHRIRINGSGLFTLYRGSFDIPASYSAGGLALDTGVWLPALSFEGAGALTGSNFLNFDPQGTSEPGQEPGWQESTAGVTLTEGRTRATVATGGENIFQPLGGEGDAGYLRLNADTADVVLGLVRGVELLPAGQSYAGAGGYSFDLAAGRAYRDGVEVATFSPPAPGQSLVLFLEAGRARLEDESLTVLADLEMTGSGPFFPAATLTGAGSLVVDFSGWTGDQPPGAGEPQAPADIVPAPYLLAEQYRATLTDGSSSLVLPISAASARLRSGTPSYLSVTVPAGGQYADAVETLLDGEVVLDQVLVYSDGSEVAAEVVRVNLQTVRPDQGGGSYSLTLTGYKQTTNASPQQVPVGSLIYQGGVQGGQRYRAPLVAALRAGDTALIGGQQITVAEVAVTIGSGGAIMEIAEDG